MQPMRVAATVTRSDSDGTRAQLGGRNLTPSEHRLAPRRTVGPRHERVRPYGNGRGPRRSGYKNRKSLSGQIRMKARPMIWLRAMGPKNRLSDESVRLSPITK